VRLKAVSISISNSIANRPDAWSFWAQALRLFSLSLPPGRIILDPRFVEILQLIDFAIEQPLLGLADRINYGS